MFCRKCGQKLPDNAVFCPQCGEKRISLNSGAVSEQVNIPKSNTDTSVNIPKSNIGTPEMFAYKDTKNTREALYQRERQKLVDAVDEIVDMKEKRIGFVTGIVIAATVVSIIFGMAFLERPFESAGVFMTFILSGAVAIGSALGMYIMKRKFDIVIEIRENELKRFERDTNPQGGNK